MSQHSNHLTDIQIKEYLRSQPGDRPDGRDALFDAHLAECETCLGRTLELQRAQLSLDRPRVSHTRHSNCPSNQTILDLAAGLGPAESTAVTIRHAAHCDFCGPLLKNYLEEFSEEMTEEAAAFMAQRSTATAAWREKIVAENIPGREPLNVADWFKKVAGSMVPKLPAQRWAFGSVAALLLVAATTGVTTLIVLRAKPSPTQAKALALAAAPELNTMEMQLPGARYAAYEVKMGPGSEPKKSLSLVKAEAILLTQKGAGRMDAKWLEVEGLTTLLEGTGSGAATAVSDFERARAEGRDDPSLEIELAISYYASYYASDPLKHPDYLPKAIDLLEGVLKRPNLPDEDKKAALYNLAVVHESRSLWRDAVNNWTEYLKLDSSSDWAKNARSRLEKAKSKVEQQSRSPADSPDDAVLQAQVEQYMDFAIRHWLPVAVKDPQSKAALYTRKLADLLAEQHSDPWLRDFINALHANQLEAVQALADALGKNRQGLYDEALAKSRNALAIFSLHHNVPGELRARLEEVYARRRSLDTQDCLNLAEPLEVRLSNTKYLWLQAQMDLEEAACLNTLKKSKNSAEKLADSKKIAEQHDFPVLQLRILAFTASIALSQGRYDESWRTAVDGLQRYARGTYPLARLYEFYSVMEQYAEKKHLFRAQQALLQQAIAIQEKVDPEDEDVILKGAEYGRLSVVSMALKEGALAKETKQKSNALLTRALSEPYVDKYVLYVKNDLAQAQLDLGDAPGALETLEPMQALALKIKDDLIAGDFHGIVGDGYRRVGRIGEAAKEYHAAVVVAEKALATLNDESQRLRWVQGASPIYRGLTLLLLDQGKQTDALQLWEWYGSRSQKETHATAEISWDELHRQIFTPLPASPSESRLIYVAFEDRLQIWTVNAKGINGHSVPITLGELEQKIRAFARECATPPGPQSNQDDLLRAGKTLGALFLEPVLAEISPGQPVVVEMDEKLSSLPLLALVRSDGHFFAQDYAVTASPGMYREKDLRRPLPIASGARVLVAQGSGNLPGQDDLIDKMSAKFANATVLKPKDVSQAEISHKLPASEVFLVISHGIQDGYGTALLLGSDRLRAEDFRPILLQRLKLAVLEACSSGASTQNGPSDPANLVRAFQAAGVPNVISTRWDVDSQSTSELMAAFFQYLSKGHAASQAMFHARNDALRARNHPYYWAGLEVAGRAN